MPTEGGARGGGGSSGAAAAPSIVAVLPRTDVNSLNLEMPMATIEQKLRALRQWQKEGALLCSELALSLGDLSHRMQSAETECGRLRAAGTGTNAANASLSPSPGPAKRARGASGEPVAAATQAAAAAAVADTTSVALERSDGQLTALSRCVRGVVEPEASLVSNSRFLRVRVQSLQGELAVLRKDQNQSSPIYQLLSIRDARSVLFNQHFTNLGLPALTMLAQVSVQFRLWVHEALAKLPMVVALGGCDEEAKDGWSDGDLKSLEILQLVPQLSAHFTAASPTSNESPPASASGGENAIAASDHLGAGARQWSTATEEEEARRTRGGWTLQLHAATPAKI